MTNYHFKNDGLSHSQREKNSLVTNIIISIVLGGIVAFTNNIYWGIGIGLFFFIIQYFKSDRWDKTFISNISFDPQKTNIEFSLRNKNENLNGETNEFKIKKEIAFNKTKTPYLAIYHNSELQIKQFEMGDWTETKMDEVVSAFSKI
jgi:hypothetical protein